MTHIHPDSGDEIEQKEFEQLRRDVEAQLPQLVDALNSMLLRAAKLGIEKEITVFNIDETVKRHDMTLPDWDFRKQLGKTIAGPKYPSVFVGQPGLVKKRP